jgi:O-antigen/teichoic acid export membrane protein
MNSRRSRRIGVEGIQIAFGQAIAVIGGLVGVRLLTGVLAPAQYGELALGLSLGGFVTQASLGPIQQGALRFFGPAQEANELRACLRATWSLVGATARVLSIGAAMALAALALNGHSDWTGLAAGSFFLALVSGYERVLDALQSAGRQRAITAWHQALAPCLRFAFAVALVTWFGARSGVAMLGYLIGTALVLLSQLGFFWRRWWPKVSREPSYPAVADKWRRQISEYARPFIVWGAFAWVQQSSDRWALQTFSTTSDVGYYSVLYQIGYAPIMLLTGVVVQLLQPILFNRAGDGTDHGRVTDTRRLTYTGVWVFFAVTVVGVALAQVLHAWVFRMFVAAAYREASGLLPWMVLSAGLFACGELLATVLMTGLRTKRLSTVKIVTALVGIGLNVAGAYWLGLRGVVFASLGFSGLSLGLTMITCISAFPRTRPARA